MSLLAHRGVRVFVLVAVMVFLAGSYALALEMEMDVDAAAETLTPDQATFLMLGAIKKRVNLCIAVSGLAALISLVGVLQSRSGTVKQAG